MSKVFKFIVSTPNLGAGIAPAGTSPFGFGAPAVITTRETHLFAMSDMGETGVGSARRIDPTTRDYVIDAETGLTLGYTATQQNVYLALVTLRGSSILATLGSDVSKIQVARG